MNSPFSIVRCPLSVALVVAMLAIIASGGPATQPAAVPASQPAIKALATSQRSVAGYVIVFDFAGGESGKQLADSVRLRLARHKDFFYGDFYDVMDGLTTAETSGPLEVTADQAKIVRMMTDQLAVNVAIYGQVAKNGKGVSVEVCCIDLRDGVKAKTWTRKFSDDTERARGVIAMQIVEALTGQAEWKPPEYGDEKEPDAKSLGKPINANGDFEKGAASWDRPDGVSTFIEKLQGHGNILRVRTDLERDAWLEYTRNLRLGLADPDKPPALKRDTSYGCVGGMEGVHYRSEWIKVAPGDRFWLLADHKGPGGAKVFVKGYRDAGADIAGDGLPEVSLVERKMTPKDYAALTDAERAKIVAADAKLHPERYRREVYRWYLNCAESGGQWKHFAAPVPPRGGLPKNVEWVQIQIYSYWPPGEYFWDNVNLYKDPNQKAPIPEEPAYTPNFGKATTKR